MRERKREHSSSEHQSTHTPLWGGGSRQDSVRPSSRTSVWKLFLCLPHDDRMVLLRLLCGASFLSPLARHNKEGEWSAGDHVVIRWPRKSKVLGTKIFAYADALWAVPSTSLCSRPSAACSSYRTIPGGRPVQMKVCCRFTGGAAFFSLICALQQQVRVWARRSKCVLLQQRHTRGVHRRAGASCVNCWSQIDVIVELTTAVVGYVLVRNTSQPTCVFQRRWAATTLRCMPKCQTAACRRSLPRTQHLCTPCCLPQLVSCKCSARGENTIKTTATVFILAYSFPALKTTRPLLSSYNRIISLHSHGRPDAMDSKIADGAKVATDERPPVHATEVLAAAIGAAEQAKSSDASEQQAEESRDGVPAPSLGVGSGEQGGSGRLASLVPTLGRFASRAHQASAPYLSYAALASQEAARCVSGRERRT